MSLDAIFITNDEAQALCARMEEDSLIGESLRKQKAQLDHFLASAIWVPSSGPPGGDEHERHKDNYTQIFNAGRFFLITGDNRYLNFIRDCLLQYVKVYPELDYAKAFTPNPPGKLFHQILNEHMWLLFASAGYSCVKHSLSDKDKSLIEQKVFHPMVNMFVETYDYHFDIIHNHGIWAVAAVGICGLAVDCEDYVNCAVYGRKLDSVSGGFLAQLSQLFSPEGYYEEGPYYQRFAIQPLLMFAEALERHRPELGIYNFRDQLVLRALCAPLYTSYPNGQLIPINDANKDMTIRSLGFLVGASFAFRRYDSDQRMLWLTKQLQEVWVDYAGLILSDAYHASSNDKLSTSLGSIELGCGVSGEKGALGILRSNSSYGDQSIISMAYGSHGLREHGHFDGLSICFFNRGQEVLSDYGCVRWLNVEPKNGGCYVKENKTWAKQTIAHNTVTVDQKTQNRNDGVYAESMNGQRAYFTCDDDVLQAMSGRISNFYDGVDMQRTSMLLKHELFEYPLLIDLFHIESEQEHEYDYVFHYHGQYVRTDFPITDPGSQTSIIGSDNGYQHLWKQAEGQLQKESGLFTWLHGNSFYTLVTNAGKDANVLFTRLGANDPEFNLRSQPGIIFRQKGCDHVFASVLETHGIFDQSIELSRGARGIVQTVEVLTHTRNYTAIKIQTEKEDLIVCAANTPQICNSQTHALTVSNQRYNWTGPVGFWPI